MAFTGLGSKLAISASRGTTYDDDATTGFPSLTYTDIDDLLSSGTVLGGKWGSTSDNFMESGEQVTSKTSKSATEFTVSHFSDVSNAGTAILDAAYESRNYYSFKLTNGAGDALYFEAHVTGRNENGGDTESHERIEHTIMPRSLSAVKVKATP